MGFLTVSGLKAAADRAVTSPLFAWTWSGASDQVFVPRLSEFRPSDPQSVIEMMDGKYLMGGTLVDTDGVSPFAIPDVPPAFFAELHGFGWLRHFRELRDAGQRGFARTLLVDWIGRHGTFDRAVWTPQLTARRILSWLKNLNLLIDGASPDQQRTIHRILARQVQSLRLRESLIIDPGERLIAAIALAGAALSSDRGEEKPTARLAALERQLDAQIDADGLHKSRNPQLQLQILSEIIPLRAVAAARTDEYGSLLSRRIEDMRRALERLVLPTGEPGYFNGCGQVPVETVLAVLGSNASGRNPAAIASGYGVLVDGRGKLIADSGLVPPLAYAGRAHAGALSFEFAYGNTLIVGNCGPAPAQLPESTMLFRQSSAHSAPTIDEASSATLGGIAALRDRLRRRGAQPDIVWSPEDNALDLTSPAYLDRQGVSLSRRVSLLGGGQTLVGQDRIIAGSRPPRAGEVVSRFHLAPGARASRAEGEELIQIVLRTGEVWTFLWEGAFAYLEESVRHSLHFGLATTEQIVLAAPAGLKTEIAWVFTRQGD